MTNPATCEYCGRIFIPRKNNRGRFCSRPCAMQMRWPPSDVRLWAKVDKSAGPDSCWPWMGATIDGYGVIMHQGKRGKRTHILAYELTYGPIPPTMCVCHHCDNRACCNPAHLFLGTTADNNADMCRKERQVKGTRAHSAKLTPDQVIAIRKEHATGIATFRGLGRKYGVSKTAISRLIKGHTWKHLIS